MTTALIALDWGTSRLRAYRVDSRGAIEARRTLDCGISCLPAGGFATALADACADWLAAAPHAPLIASGMVGSRQGWLEAPYVQCPATLDDLAAGLTEVELTEVACAAGRVLYIVAGVSMDGGRMPDVMRGEETQVIGAASAMESVCMESACVVLPGTHSKWVDYAHGSISSFATHMTGEVFALLRGHSILSVLMEGDGYDAQAFGDGVMAGQEAGCGGGLLHRLFGVRTLTLFGRLAPHAGASYLSGLLIGAEIAAAVEHGYGAGAIVLLGSEDLIERYRVAFALLRMQAVAGPDDAAPAGLTRIAQRAGLISIDRPL
ncbi:MAG: hypothetical protein GKR94_10100 [Gammaproteobacteria bacterium]|nr:hypothetical protein [Gammaproteobacteria bacterium]